MRWSYHLEIDNMRCVLVYYWNDNYLCVPQDLPYHFQWSEVGEIENEECLRWNEPVDPDMWHDNYLCTHHAKTI